MTRTVLDIPLGDIYLNEASNCRIEITTESILSLAQSIDIYGQQTPIAVSPTENKYYSYRLLSGHRRFRAMEYLGRETIEGIIREVASEQEALLLNLSENIDRESLSPYEEALALVNIFPEGATLRKMSKILNRSIEWCRRRRLISEFDSEIQQAFHVRLLGIRDVLALSTVKKDKRHEIALGLIEARREESKGQIPMGTVTKKPHKTTREIELMSSYFLNKKINGLPSRLLSWVLGYTDSKTIRRLTRQAEKSGGGLYDT